jgi:hypothetical protein
MGQVPSNTSCGTVLQAKGVIENAISTINAKAAEYTTIINGINSQTPGKIQLLNFNSDLSGQIQSLNEQIKQLQGTIERHDRDFVDLESTTEPNTSSIHVLDDYTLWMLILSYTLFALSIIFMYSHTHYYSISSILLSVLGMAIITFFLVVLAIIIL